MVESVVLMRWQDLQSEIRHLALQRGLRFVAAAILAPFGAANVGRGGDGSTPHVSGLAFGMALFLLAVAEMAAIAESGLHVHERKQLEKRHPALAPDTKPNRVARALAFLSGPAFSTALYALLGAAVVIASSH